VALLDTFMPRPTRGHSALQSEECMIKVKSN
jgi:hypothetical protein